MAINAPFYGMHHFIVHVLKEMVHLLTQWLKFSCFGNNHNADAPMMYEYNMDCL